ncbi:MAG: hypothetical protein E7070_04425 [Bacteroidales bacterium]|jgi:hypothetical protein|nr:hypothetical protein [Bacteroidales bacterium]
MTIFEASFCSAVPTMSNSREPIFPCLRIKGGDKKIWCPSPLHGRSFVVGRSASGRYIVTKGNGLSYTKYTFLHTGEFYDDTWGLLLRHDAERDFTMGLEIESLGIKTNHMEYVLELDLKIKLPNGHEVKPCLLQYDVACPYRICDAPFMTQTQIDSEVEGWKHMNSKNYRKKHMIAADVLIRNLRILHDHGVLHNAIGEQNYTWSLELLDFELACSPMHPYSSEDDMRHVRDLFQREILQSYVVINYIAGVLRETVDYDSVDELFSEYGFCLNKSDVLDMGTFEMPLDRGN